MKNNIIDNLLDEIFMTKHVIFSIGLNNYPTIKNLDELLLKIVLI